MPRRIAIIVILWLVATLHHGAEAQKVNGVVLDQPELLPTFELQDQDGNAFGIDRLKDHWSMILVGFTSCPDVCPFTLGNLGAVRSELGLRLRPDRMPNIIFLAVDPERDKPVLKGYIDHFNPNFIGLTGTPKQIDKLVAGLDAFYRLEKKRPNDQDYTVKHSAAVSIINPKAEVVAKISPPFHPHRTGDYLAKLIQGAKFDD